MKNEEIDGAISSHTHTHTTHHVPITSAVCRTVQHDTVRRNNDGRKRKRPMEGYETHRLTILRWLFDTLNSVASSLQTNVSENRKPGEMGGLNVMPDQRETKKEK
jgi:hypothetical protein